MSIIKKWGVLALKAILHSPTWRLLSANYGFAPLTYSEVTRIFFVRRYNSKHLRHPDLGALPLFGSYLGCFLHRPKTSFFIFHLRDSAKPFKKDFLSLPSCKPGDQFIGFFSYPTFGFVGIDSVQAFVDENRKGYVNQVEINSISAVFLEADSSENDGFFPVPYVGEFEIVVFIPKNL